MPRPVEMVLARQWLSLLTTPALLFEESGDLVYFNEAAAGVLGRTYGESGGLSRREWEAAFRLEDEHGEPIPTERSPVAIALDARSPANATVRLRALDGRTRGLQITALPLGSLSQCELGVVAWLHEQR
ncbi:MAG: hypothetical protein VX899_11170 [Myxococcota bacterium]|nr:hypothetical protein [Myxococcota bacterium]